MAKTFTRPQLTRRNFLKLGGGLLVAAAGSYALPKALLKAKTAQAAPNMHVTPNMHLAATDGWISIPGAQVAEFPGALPEQAYHPDPFAPGWGGNLGDPQEPLSTYVFGFNDVTAITLGQGQYAGLTEEQKAIEISTQKMKAQHAAPIIGVDQEEDFFLQLSNLGFQMRPDLIDGHTVHWHGFKNAIPMFDGEPHSSFGVPIGRSFMYHYRPHDAGTYLYHCHVEEIEHIHMGMTGVAYVRPFQNRGGAAAGAGDWGVHPSAPVARLWDGGAPAGNPLGYVYNDGVLPGDPLSTAYDREFALILTEVWAYMHWGDSHVQLVDWTNYKPDFYLINGRAYPDTIALTGDPKAPANEGKRLQYQPYSALIQANEGEKIALRFVNLGFQSATLTLGGIPMRLVGKDASPLRGRSANGQRLGATDSSYFTHALTFGSGESAEAIFTAPAYDVSQAVDDGTGRMCNKYLFYNRNFNTLTTGLGGLGGHATEVHVYPASTLAAQTAANQLR